MTDFELALKDLRSLSSGKFLTSDRLFRCRKLVSDEYLREHPDDDDEPVAEEWLRSLTDPRHFGSHPRFDFGDASLHMDYGAWVLTLRGYEARQSKQIETRGDVRLLCRALGIELKETNYVT